MELCPESPYALANSHAIVWQQVACTDIALGKCIQQLGLVPWQQLAPNAQPSCGVDQPEFFGDITCNISIVFIAHMSHEKANSRFNILFEPAAISNQGFDVFPKSLAVVLLARIGDLLERLFFPSVEIVPVQILGQPIKNMIQTIEDCWQVNQTKCFTVLTAQLHCLGKITNRSFAGSERDGAPTTMNPAMRCRE